MSEYSVSVSLSLRDGSLFVYIYVSTVSLNIEQDTRRKSSESMGSQESEASMEEAHRPSGGSQWSRIPNSGTLHKALELKILNPETRKALKP